MKKYIYLFLASVAITSFSSCKDSSLDALDTSYASFTSTTMDIGLLPETEVSRDINIYTTNITNSDRTIPLNVVESTTADAGAYTVPSSVVIPAGTNVGTITVGVKDVGLTIAEDKSLVLRLEASEETSAGEALTIALSLICPDNGVKLSVNITLDSYPEEGAWRIRDAEGNEVMASASPFGYGAYAGMTGTITIKECLPSGTYTIQIYDQYGDAGTGYTVSANGINLFTDSGDYEGGEEASFTI
ncbi:hypothetical protein [Polaribacter sp. 20A6]|uniref:hypothetical protein n=1 Tax=Polaribacter sp. 20A6 TaxID=2687289 RepID=UPI0013FD635B|nr:hypothetical protein [Polaribacter sp. 20A6]